MSFAARGLVILPALPRNQLKCGSTNRLAERSRSISSHASSSSSPFSRLRPHRSSPFPNSSRTRPVIAKPSPLRAAESVRNLSVWPIWKRTSDPRAGEGEAEFVSGRIDEGSTVSAVRSANDSRSRPDVEATSGTIGREAPLETSGHVAPTQTPDLQPEIHPVQPPISSSPTLPASSSSDSLSSTTPSSLQDLLPQLPALPSSTTLDDLIALNPDNLQEVLDSPEAVHAAMRIGDLKLMGLEKGLLNPVGWIQSLLEVVHVGTGMPWWATIISFTICVRLALLPLVIRGQRNNVKLAAISPQTSALTQKLNEAKTIGDTVAMSVYSRQLQTLFKENHCSPFGSLWLPLAQVPIFLSFFFAVRGLATLPVPQLKEGGLWWFEDLTLADPYWILPVVSMALQLAVLEVGADGMGGAAGQSRQTQHFKNVFRFMIVIAIPFIGRIASAMTFYWTFTNAFTLIQASLLKQSAVRRFLSIPTPRRAPTPQNIKPQPAPTMLDTFREGRAMFKKTHIEAATKAAERVANRSGKGSTSIGPIPTAVRSNPAMEHGEVILESPAMPSPNSGKLIAVPNTGKLIAVPNTSSQPAASPVLTAVTRQKSEKEQRIAAARARREKRA